jgi:ribonuclease P protein component
MHKVSRKFIFPKRQKLCSEKDFKKLFFSGRNVFFYPVKTQYAHETKKTEDTENIQVAVSVSKKNIKKAWQRNKIKRRMREAWRLNSLDYQSFLHGNGIKATLVFIFVGKEVLPFETIETGIKRSINELLKKLNTQQESI